MLLRLIGNAFVGRAYRSSEKLTSVEQVTQLLTGIDETKLVGKIERPKCYFAGLTGFRVAPNEEKRSYDSVEEVLADEAWKAFNGESLKGKHTTFGHKDGIEKHYLDLKVYKTVNDFVIGNVAIFARSFSFQYLLAQ